LAKTVIGSDRFPSSYTSKGGLPSDGSSVVPAGHVGAGITRRGGLSVAAWAFKPEKITNIRLAKTLTKWSKNSVLKIDSLL
jgi:hypothetical protein